MNETLKQFVNDRPKAVGVVATLIIVNIVIWLAAWRLTPIYPFLLANAWLAYGFGLRHAVDADHISAIDNVTRKLVREGGKPTGVGMFFSLGHSTVVIALCAAIAVTSGYVHAHMAQWQSLGGVLGTVVSGVFLYAIGLINLVVLLDLWRTYKKATVSGDFHEEQLEEFLAQRGLLGRLFKPMLRMVTKSWHMYAVGFLFGLGFDTATEVGILAISAHSANHGVSIWAIMLLPLLFTAGMCLIDTVDGILMTGAYGWSALKPSRKFRYNFSITLLSVVVAFAVGTYELVEMAATKFSWKGPFWGLLGRLDFSNLGMVLIAVFLIGWAVSALVARRDGRTSVEPGG